MKTFSLEQAEEAVRTAKPEEQRRFLARLPKLLLSADTYVHLKNAEPSFAFWDNSEDGVYDDL